MVESGEKKIPLVIKFLLLSMIYPKAIRIIDNEKVFYRKSKKYNRDRRLPELCV